MVSNVNQRWLSVLIITLLSLPSSLVLTPNSWSQEKANETEQGQLKSSDTQQRIEDLKDLAERADAGQKNPIPEPVMEELVIALQDPSPDVRRKAVDSVIGIGTGAEEAIPYLANILQDRQNQPTDLRQNTIIAIRSVWAGYAVEPLIKALDDPDPGVRSRAVKALGSSNQIGRLARDKFSELKVVSKVIELAEKDPFESVRGSAAEALANIDPLNQEVWDTLNKALEKDHSWRVRRDASTAWERIADGIDDPSLNDYLGKKVTPNLLKALENGNSTLRTSAAQTLGVLGSGATKAVPSLREALLENEDPFVQGAAAKALGNIGDEDPETFEALIKALGFTGQEKALVRERSFEAFKTIAVSKTDKLLGQLDQSDQPEIKADELEKTIEYFEKVLVKMPSEENGFSQKHKNELQPSLNRLKSKRAEEAFINIILKNPWVWGILVYLALHFGLFWLRPLWLLKIDQVLKPLNFKVPLLGMQISPRFLLFLKFRSRVLDAWVAAHIQSVQEKFQAKKTIQARQVYIPSPVILDGRTVTQITSQDLRAKFNRHLLIWGEGGAGKTSLASQIAQWAMADNQNERLCPHRMLPILIEENFDCEGESCKQSLLDIILGQLQDLTDEREPIARELLERLLRRQRILVIVDHLSEMSEQTQETIDPGKPDFPINALIVTSRQEEKLNGVHKTIIQPLRIEGNRLSSFMEAYLTQEGKRDLFTDSEFFDACSRLSRMVGQKRVTAMLATLYAKQLITAKLEAAQDIPVLIPNSIPDLMISYLNELNRDLTDSKLEEDRFDDRQVHQDAKALAWACLQEMYLPTTIRRETAIATLAEVRGEKAEDHLQYLEERLRLIQTIGATKDHLRFSLDPLAEYLAGLHLIDIYKEDESQWLEFLEQAQAKSNSPATISGFLGAVQDCCIVRGKEAKISSLILTKLAQIQNKVTQATAFANT